MPSGPTATAAAAWSCVEKMLQLAHRTSAPSSVERLDQHRGLDGHVQRARDAGAGQRLRRPELLAQGAQAGHLVLGEVDLAAPERGEREVGDAEVAARLGSGFSGRHGRDECRRRSPVAGAQPASATSASAEDDGGHVAEVVGKPLKL